MTTRVLYSSSQVLIQFKYHHQLNKASTRSHCIFTVAVERTPRGGGGATGTRDRGQGVTGVRSGGTTGLGAGGAAGGGGKTGEAGGGKRVMSKLNLVDLAGSERLVQTGSTGEVRWARLGARLGAMDGERWVVTMGVLVFCVC